MKRRYIVLLLIGMLAIAALTRMWVVGTDTHLAPTSPALSRLGPYHAGMRLRDAYESLPASADRTALTLLLDNPAAWVARWRLLADTRESLDVSYLLLREGLFGGAFLGYLMKKAQAGVKIRLMLDGQGTTMSFTSPRGNDWLDTLANTGN